MIAATRPSSTHDSERQSTSTSSAIPIRCQNSNDARHLSFRGRSMRAIADAMAPGARRGLVLGFAFLAAAIFGAYELSGMILSNDVISLSLVAMICVAAGFVLAILRNWRHGVYCLIAWLLFEDFVRKYAGNNMAIYFAKDILTAIVYLSFFLAYRRRDKDLVVARPRFYPRFLSSSGSVFCKSSIPGPPLSFLA